MNGSQLSITIDGNRFDDIQGFYEEINRIFMADEAWQLGESLDAFNDLLYGGYGALKGAETVVLHWKNIEKSRADLGTDATRRWLTAKLAQPGHFNLSSIQAQINALDHGVGPTYFEILLNILADHPRIRLAPA